MKISWDFDAGFLRYSGRRFKTGIFRKIHLKFKNALKIFLNYLHK